MDIVVGINTGTGILIYIGIRAGTVYCTGVDIVAGTCGSVVGGHRTNTVGC